VRSLLIDGDAADLQERSGRSLAVRVASGEPLLPCRHTGAGQVAATIASTVAKADLYRRTARFAEEREVRARLDSKNRELVRIDQLKRRFFSLVSH